MVQSRKREDDIDEMEQPIYFQKDIAAETSKYFTSY